MKLVPTVQAEGHVLCHDITQIIRGVSKGPRFRKGHVVKKDDIPVLISIGKENLYVWEKKEGVLHEDEAAEVLYNICAGDNMKPTEPKEGKISVIAEKDGLFTVDTQRLKAVNSLGEIMIATRHGNFPVKAGDELAGTRVIPLTIEKEKMDRAKDIAGDKPLLTLHEYKSKKAGIVTTGSEVIKGLVEDTFTPVVVSKLGEYGISIIGQEMPGDEASNITKSIEKLFSLGADIVVCTGGMSVDPDDRTPLGIKNTGAEIVSYGAPVLPGAMFMLSYLNGRAIMGLPGCVMYSKRTIFDLILPRIAAGIKVTAEDLAVLGHGGLCLNCETCIYPNCGFGKGV